MRNGIIANHPASRPPNKKDERRENNSLERINDIDEAVKDLRNELEKIINP